jgi:hypothetical protein
MQTQKRELETAIEHARKELQEGKARWQRCHYQRQKLKHRVDECQQSILRSTSALTLKPSPLQGSCLSESEIEPYPIDLKGDTRHPTQPMQPNLSKRSQSTLHHQLVKAIWRNSCNKRCEPPSPKSVSAFKHHVIISFSALGKYMPSRNLFIIFSNSASGVTESIFALSN